MSETRRTAEAAERSRAARIRRLAYSDLPAVLAIERRCFDAPWSLAMFLAEISRPESACLAAEDGHGLCGYLVCTRYPDAWHLTNVAVDPRHRRLGLGTRLIVEMLEIAGPGGEITLEVRPSNAAAVAIYERLGFRSAGVRPGYYPDNREDALIMWRHGATARERVAVGIGEPPGSADPPQRPVAAVAGAAPAADSSGAGRPHG